MTTSAEQIQIFYEISMSIGVSLDLRKMVKRALFTYLKKLNCSAGKVLRKVEAENGKCSFEKVHSIPRDFEKIDNYKTIIKSVLSADCSDEYNSFLQLLPIKYKTESGQNLLIMNLSGFGLLILISAADSLDDYIVNSIRQINSKLAAACSACVQNEALQKSEEKYRSIFNTIQDVYSEVDAVSGEILEISPSAKQIGYSRKEMLGRNINEFYAKPEQHQEMMKMLNKNDSVNDYEISMINKAGQKMIVSFSVSLIRNEANKPYKVVGTMRDITGRKQAEEEKAKLEIQLRQSQKLETIGTLAGGIAHDFNNILAPIMGYTDMALFKTKETDPVHEDLKHVLIGTHRAKELVEQIFLFSKQTEKKRQPLELQIMVKEVLKLLRPSIPTTIEIQQRIDNSCAKVIADAIQIHQVIVNLCTNAWQAMEENGGILTIELKQIEVDAATAKLHPKLNEAEYACLSIIDTGPGIDKAIIDRIFEPFFTTKAVNKGTGLGLSVVHGIVCGHKGDIWVYSEQGKGSAFHVYLPIIKTEQELVGAKSREIIGGSEFVMIVDDEPAIGKMVKVMLENFGYKVEFYKSGLAALKAFKKKPDKYDLLITDLTMPQMTGLDLSNQLHKKRPELPVVIMTGLGDSLTVPNQERYGIKQVLGKPVTVKEITTAVRKVLDD